MTLQDLITQAMNNKKTMTRKERAIDNYQAITGLRAPDDLHESWADRFPC